MKLSDAMMLGSVTAKMIPGNWNSCALGAAANAVGLPKQEREFGGDLTVTIVNNREELILNQWPWLKEHSNQSYIEIGKPGNFSVVCDLGGGNPRWLSQIWSRFDCKVCEGVMTFEELVDYVRSVEPDCDQCNSFKCVCQKPVEPETEVAEAVSVR